MTTVRRSSKTFTRWSKLKDQAKQAGSEQPAVSQRTVDRLTKERDELKKKLDVSQKDNDKLKSSLCTIAKKAMDVTNPTPFLTGSEKDPGSMTEEEVTELIGKLSPAEQNVSLESRIEELETRITLLSGELGKMMKLKLNMESQLSELISCEDLVTMRQTARLIRHQSCATKLFAGPSIKLEDVESEENATDSSSQCSDKTNQVKHKGLPPRVQVNLEPVTMEPPTKPRKAPDTHIKNMQPDLRQLVIQDLSLYKGNGADWRLFAQRVGVPETLTDQWQQMKIPQPMRNVLGVWAASQGATVRMLHRHLVSPQMRCVLLARRITDYYDVD